MYEGSLDASSNLAGSTRAGLADWVNQKAKSRRGYSLRVALLLYNSEDTRDKTALWEGLRITRVTPYTDTNKD